MLFQESYIQEIIQVILCIKSYLTALKQDLFANNTFSSIHN